MPRQEKSKNSPAKQTAAQAKEKNTLKTGSFVLASALVIIGNLNWLFLSWILTTIQPLMWLMAALLFAIYIALFILIILLIPQRKWVMLGWFLSLVGLPLWFGFFWTSFLATIIGFLVGLSLMGRLLLQMKNLARLRLWPATRNGLEFMLIGLMLALSLSYFSQLKSADDNGTSAVQDIRGVGTNMLGNLLAWKVSGYDPLMTIDDLINRLAEMASEEISKKMTSAENTNYVPEGQSIEFADLPPEQQQQMIEAQKEASQNAVQEELRKQLDAFFQQYHIQADGETPVGQVVDQLVNNTFMNALGTYSSWLNHFMTLGLFLILLILTPFLRFLIRLMTIILMRCFKATHLVTVHTEKREVEVVEIK